ncbi:MAG: choice-of-anchor B family protein [Ignavibacteria bacterium]|nr:choice-of-anchor B family protein [Ignavibacteria bacterium]
MRMFLGGIPALVMVTVLFPLHTEGQNLNVTLHVNLNEYASWGYTDVWGYEAQDGREYALLGVNGGVSIVDVTDTNAIAEVDFVPWVSTGFTGWYDMKTYRNYMYVSSEQSSNVLIVDLSALPDSARIVGTTMNFQTSPHNIYVDTTQAILFVIEDFNFSGPVDLLDLSDPENPALLSTLGPGLGTDAHDVFAQDEVLYVAEGVNGSVGIFDISNPAAPSLLSRLNIPSPGYVHNVWVSPDNTVMMTTEETTDHTVKAWDISDVNNISLLDEYIGPARLPHNVTIRGSFAYLSHYESGLIILDISDPSHIVEVGNYDTYPASNNPTFRGAWGVYPFGRDNKIFMGDGITGLYVLEFTGSAAYRIQGTLESATSGLGIEDGWVEVVETGAIERTGTDGSFVIGSGLSSITLRGRAYGYAMGEVALNGTPGSTDTVTISLGDALTGSLGGTVTDNTMSPLVGAEVAVTASGLLFEEPVTLVAVTDGDGAYVFDDLFVSDGDWLRYDTVTAVQVFPNASSFVEGIVIEAGSLTIQDFELFPANYLLVNDDPAGGYLSEYVAALSASGGIPYLWETATDGEAIPASAIDGMTSPLVVWYTGDATTDVLTTTAQESLAVVLNNGGSLLLAGRGIASSLAAQGSSFLTDYLESGSGGTVSGTSFIASVAGNPMSGGLSGFLAIGGDKDIIDPVVPGNATSAFTYTGGSSAGVTVENPSTGSKTAFLGFGLENISAATSRQAVATAAMTWLGLITEVEPVTSSVPDRFTLSQNFPNPFNPSTSITFQVPAQSTVSLVVFNLLGQEVARLIDNQQIDAGSYAVEWDGTGSSGRQVASGIYLYRLEAAGEAGTRFTDMRKMVFLK